jgi:hypothetical protein
MIYTAASRTKNQDERRKERLGSTYLLYHGGSIWQGQFWPARQIFSVVKGRVFGHNILPLKALSAFRPSRRP